MISFLIEYRLYFLLAIPTLFGYFWLSQFKEKLRIKEWMALVLSVLHTLIGVLCVKLFAFLESGGEGGMSLYGAVFFLPVIYFTFAKLSKRSISNVFDVFTICTVCTLLCARFNCMFAHCCLGKVIPGTETMRWPTRELEIIFYLALFIFLRKKVCKKKYRGLIYPIYMMSYGVFRFVVEFFRESDYVLGFIHISHIWSLVAIIAGAGMYYLITKKGGNRHKHLVSTR